VGWDGYIDVRGNRYSVPDKLCGADVVVRIGLDGMLKVYDRAGQLVARHLLKPVAQGWSYEPGHHRDLWQHTLPAVERRSLARGLRTAPSKRSASGSRSRVSGSGKSRPRRGASCAPPSVHAIWKALWAANRPVPKAKAFVRS
jgi:hypothetical protein